MNRSAAAQLLGIRDSATRGEARVAYMALLQKASRELAAGSDEFAARQAQLRDAYAAFSDSEYETSASPASYADHVPQDRPMQSSEDTRFLGGTVRTWAILLLVASLAIAFATWSTLGGPGGTSTATEQSSDEATSTPTQESTPRAASTRPQTPDRGQSGLLNTCWRDETPAFGSTDNESTPVTQVICSSSRAQWRVYKETRTTTGCTDQYLSTQDGWTLCIRPM